jgi:hypothetical protein
MKIDRGRQALYGLLVGAAYVVGHADAIASLLPKEGKAGQFLAGLIAVCGLATRAFSTHPEVKK